MDDGSIDRTYEVSCLAGARTIRLEENKGKAHAVMEGFALAREHGCTIAVMLDDNSEQIPITETGGGEPYL